jgi:hypothetical protein
VYRFLELYQEARTPKLVARQFRSLIGDEVADALLRAEVLRPSPTATRYPCESGRLGCPRRIVANCGHPSHPWVAVCGLPFPACEEIPLTDADLEEYRTSHERFANLVRRLLRVRGSFKLLDSAYADTVQLGEIEGRSGIHDAFLSLAAWDRSLPTLLAERMLVQRRSIVFVPTNRGVSLELIHRHPPGAHVTLAFLVDILAARDGEFVVLPTFAELFAPRTRSSPSFCRLLTSKGARDLTRAEYDDVVRKAGDFDLFVDAVVPSNSTKYAAGRRRTGRRYDSAELTRLEATAIAELVIRGAPVRARDLNALQGVLHPARTIEAARRKVDVRLARYKWRAIHTHAAGNERDCQYVFSPPASLGYAILASTSERTT